MILPSTPKSAEDAQAIVNAASFPEQSDPPPPYLDTQLDAPSGSGSLAASEPPSPGVRPMNFLSLSRGTRPIKGIYTIDTHVKVPQALLPPLAPDETEASRKNVVLQTSTGSIDVDLFVTGGVNSKVDILLKSSDGPITARLHASSRPRPSLRITAESSSGPIAIHLPSSFCGPVILSTPNPAIHLSDRLAAELTTFSEEEHARRGFVGDYTSWTEGEWAGDALSVESASGSVSLRYDADPAWDTSTPNGVLPLPFTRPTENVIRAPGAGDDVPDVVHAPGTRGLRRWPSSKWVRPRARTGNVAAPPHRPVS